MDRLGKPIAAFCISPVNVAKLLGNAELTIGNDPDTAALLENRSARRRRNTFGEVIVEEHHNVITTPGFMLDASIPNLEQVVQHIVKMIVSMQLIVSA